MSLKSAVKCVTEYPGIKPVWPQKWSFKISSGQIQNYLSAVPTDCFFFLRSDATTAAWIDGKAVIPNSSRLIRYFLNYLWVIFVP